MYSKLPKISINHVDFLRLKMSFVCIGAKNVKAFVPFMKPQPLPGCQRLCRVLQHPQLVEEHHVEEHQQDQAEGRVNK